MGDANGLYCLNDLHWAVGGEDKNKLSNWLANQQTKDLIGEMSLLEFQQLNKTGHLEWQTASAPS